MKVLISEKLSEHKYKTPEGYLVCTDAILARTGKQQYSRDELFLDGSSEEVDVDRPYEEVFDKATLASFENKPITVEHPSEEVTVDNYKAYAVGYVRDVHQGKTEDGHDVILGNLIITDKDTIEEIEQGKHTNLSCGYDCDIIIKDGTYTQHAIRGNHVALCECPRAGITKIVDSKMNDIDFRYLSEAEKELKEALGLYKRVEGKHAKNPAFNGEKQHRQNQYNNAQVAELNEAINEAIRNLHNGVKDEAAWQRLAIKLEGWESDEEYGAIAKKAKHAINTFKKYLSKDSTDKERQLTMKEGNLTDDIIRDVQNYFCYNKDDSAFSLEEMQDIMRSCGLRITRVKKSAREACIYYEGSASAKEKAADKLGIDIDDSMTKDAFTLTDKQSKQLWNALRSADKYTLFEIAYHHPWRAIGPISESKEELMTDAWYELAKLKSIKEINAVLKKKNINKTISDSSVNDEVNGSLKDFNINSLIFKVKTYKKPLNSRRIDNEGNVYTIVVGGPLAMNLATGEHATLDIVKTDEDGKQSRVLIVNDAKSWNDIIEAYNDWRRTVKDSFKSTSYSDILKIASLVSKLK